MPEASDRNLTLVRGLGLVAAVSIIIGNVIGTSVFLKARVMTCNVGTPGMVLTVWVVAGGVGLGGARAHAGGGGGVARAAGPGGGRRPVWGAGYFPKRSPPPTGHRR